MHLPLKTLATAILVTATLASFTTTSQANVMPQQSELIIETFKNTKIESFRQFLTELSARDAFIAKKLKFTTANYLDNKPLSHEQQNEIHRLLGVYARVKYGSSAMETLSTLVEIPTFRVSGIPQHENPEFIKIAKKIQILAEDFGLTFRNIDNRVYEISLGGSGEEVVGIHVHADVVPVTPENWVLSDGTRLDPFKVTLIGDRMYGRGTEDDKNGIVVALYAMKVIKEENIPLLRNFKILIDTTEETSGDAMAYYFKYNPTPNYNLALDGSYPVVIAEKGSSNVMASFTRRTGEGHGAEIITMTGGMATNQIPATSVATLRSPQPTEFASRLQVEGTAYANKNGNNFQVKAEVIDKNVKLTITGVAAHSSEPETGVNPLAAMFGLIHELDEKQLIKRNHFTDAAHYATDNWGLDYLGKKLGVGFTDDFMGPLTASLTYVGIDESTLKLAVNLRIPKGKSTDILKGEIAGKLNAWSKKSGISPIFEYSITKPMYRNPEGAWAKSLLDVATENLGMPKVFGTSAGATSVHELPNGVQFGLAKPNVKYTGHTDSEFKTTEQFLLDLQIVTEMMARIGELPKL